MTRSRAAGTGQATIALADRGYLVTAIEPGRRMAALLVRKLARYPGCHVEVTRFEDWQIPLSGFALVISATAFHWVNPEVRFALAGKALQPHGALALIRNDHVAGPGSSMYYGKAKAVYERHAPHLARNFPLPDESLITGFAAEMQASGQFDVIDEPRFTWDQHYTANELIGLLRTYSDHRRLPRQARARLLADLRTLV